MAENASIYFPAGVDHDVVEKAVAAWARTVVGQVGWGIDDESADDYDIGFPVALDVKTRALTNAQLLAGLAQLANDLSAVLDVEVITDVEAARRRAGMNTQPGRRGLGRAPSTTS